MDMNDALAPVLADERVQEVLRTVEFDERVRVAVDEVTRAVRDVSWLLCRVRVRGLLR